MEAKDIRIVPITNEIFTREALDEAHKAGIRKVVELPEFQQFLWFANNVPCISELLGNVSEECGCATCLAKKIQVKLKEWGIDAS